MAKKSKYDTNPLEEEYARRAGEAMGEGIRAGRTGQAEGATRPVAEPPPKATLNFGDDAPTRRYDASYPSVFVPPPEPPRAVPPATAATAGATAAPRSKVVQRPTSRSVAGLNLPENLALAGPYLPFYIGAVFAAIELFFAPRGETRVRFHAAQGLALQAAIFAVQTIFFGTIASLTGARFGGKIFWAASTVFLIISLIRVWKGEPHYVAPLGDFTKWLDERIEPRK